MNPLDEDNEGELPFGEPSSAEQELAPDAPDASVQTFETESDFSSMSEVSSETLGAFGACFVYAHLALFLGAIGPMGWYFEGWTRVGPLLSAGGVVAGLLTHRRYRKWERQRATDDTAGSDTATAAADGEDAG